MDSKQLYIWNEFITHVPSRRVRKYMLSKMLKRYDTSSGVLLHVRFLNPGGVLIGSNCSINSYVLLDGRVSDLVIHDNVDIGPYTHIWTLEHDPNSPEHATKSGTVTIENHVWIASRVTILPGVLIGKGAVIAAGSIVTKDVPEKTIVAGVPAKAIGMRDNNLVYSINYNPRWK